MTARSLRRIWTWLMAPALSLGAWFGSAQAFEFSLIELVHSGGDERSYIEIKDFVSFDSRGKAHLNLFPERNREHRQIIETLKPGMPIGELMTRDQIAEILASYPSSIHSYIQLTLEVCPIEDIDAFVPGVKDKRRVSAILVAGYLAEAPDACFYDARQSGAVDFTIGMLMGVLRECRIATQAAIDRGEPYSDAVYTEHPILKKSAGK